jgi:hypothetical protein
MPVAIRSSLLESLGKDNRFRARKAALRPQRRRRPGGSLIGELNGTMTNKIYWFEVPKI